MRHHHPEPNGERNSATPLQRERMGQQEGLGVGAGAGSSAASGVPDAPAAPASAHAAASAAASACAAASDPQALHFLVRYTLFEYIGFTWQHCSHLIRRRRIGALASRWLCTKSTASAALHFVLQGRARRTYDFTIDPHGIVRNSGTGVTLIPWRDVSAIRRYTGCHMMVLKRGTLPIPFRCLDRGQMAAMDAYAAVVRAAARR